MGKWGLVLAIVAACYSEADIKNAECRVACLWAGYDGGSYEKQLDACQCIEIKSISITQNKRIYLPKRYENQAP